MRITLLFTLFIAFFTLSSQAQNADNFSVVTYSNCTGKKTVDCTQASVIIGDIGCDKMPKDPAMGVKACETLAIGKSATIPLGLAGKTITFDGKRTFTVSEKGKTVATESLAKALAPKQNLNIKTAEEGMIIEIAVYQNNPDKPEELDIVESTSIVVNDGE